MSSFLTRARLGRFLAASVVIPALALSSGGAAVAATNTLALTVLNRAGAKVAVSATVVDVETSRRYTVRSGTVRQLPKATYAVLTAVYSGGTTTLGGTTVKVSGNVKLTVDTRRGRLVSVGVGPAPAGLRRDLTARICTVTSASYQVDAYGESLYVIPSASKKIAFAALGAYSDPSGLTDAYAVVHQTTGVPATPRRTFSRAALGTVTVASRRGPAGSNYADVAVQPIKRGCADDLYAGLWSTDRPTTVRLRLSPGSWHIRSGTFASAKDGQTPNIGTYFAERRIAAGGSYSVRYYNAAWGPSTQLPTTIRGQVSFGLNEMFADPAFIRGDTGWEGGDRAAAVLTYGGKVVRTARDRGWEPEGTYLYHTVKKAGWYTLTNTATRYYPEITYPAGMLSTKSVVSYRFYTKPNSSALAQAYSITMLPIGLNSWNRARAGTSTNVVLKLNRYGVDADAKRGAEPKLKTLTALMSPDYGKTWRRVPVRRISGAWTAVVPNPASGYVTLRARATYASGGYTDVSIYRAYGVG